MGTTRTATPNADPRCVALGDMLAAGAVKAHTGGPRARAAAETMIAAAADAYALAYGYSGALAIPAGTRVPRRVAVVLAAAAGDPIPAPAKPRKVVQPCQ